MGQELRVTVLMSGGIDSAACAAFLMAQGRNVSAMFVDHGQAAARLESAAVEGVAAELGLELRQVSFACGSTLGDGELVGRNALLTFAALFATHARTDSIALGLHAGTPYYDCSPAFLSLINRAVAEHTDGKVQVIAPFIDWSKQDVYDYFVRSGLSVTRTYSCERGVSPSCGACASCRDRKALGC
jgi:7-cyano-7-deazaguanine synthase